MSRNARLNSIHSDTSYIDIYDQIKKHKIKYIHILFSESVSDHSVAPAFLKKLESQIVEEKDTVIMECDIIGSPQPVITWYCDKKAVPEGDRFSMSYDGRVARLIMKSATKGDNGRYECVAESSAGRVTCDCLLVVKGLFLIY